MDKRELAWQEDLNKIQDELAATKLTWKIEGVTVTATGIPDMTEQEAANYVAYVAEKVALPLASIDVTLGDDGEAELAYSTAKVPFERIRRITGYLVGTIDRWNNAKKSEEKDRVKHDG